MSEIILVYREIKAGLTFSANTTIPSAGEFMWKFHVGDAFKWRIRRSGNLQLLIMFIWPLSIIPVNPLQIYRTTGGRGRRSDLKCG